MGEIDSNTVPMMVSEGVAPDFIWYEARALSRDMQAWQDRLQKLVNTMEARQKEHLMMLEDVMQENKKLREQLESNS